MVEGLSFRAIVELITSNNESGLRSFLDTQHANIDDRNEVKSKSQILYSNQAFFSSIYLIRN